MAFILHIYLPRQTETDRDRDREKETDGQRDTETETETERKVSLGIKIQKEEFCSFFKSDGTRRCKADPHRDNKGQPPREFIAKDSKEQK